MRVRDDVIEDDDSVVMLLELTIGDDRLDWLVLALKHPRQNIFRNGRFYLIKIQMFPFN